MVFFVLFSNSLFLGPNEMRMISLREIQQLIYRLESNEFNAFHTRAFNKWTKLIYGIVRFYSIHTKQAKKSTRKSNLFANRNKDFIKEEKRERNSNKYSIVCICIVDIARGYTFEATVQKRKKISTMWFQQKKRNIF